MTLLLEFSKNDYERSEFPFIFSMLDTISSIGIILSENRQFLEGILEWK